MRVLMTGGGTGGHINPAIAIAQYIKSMNKDNEILFAGTPTGMEARMVADAGFAFEPIDVQGFSRDLELKAIPHNIKAVTKFLKSLSRAKKIINTFEPDVVIGTGGYVSGPVVHMATKMHVRTAIHEQNAFPGATTRFVASKVDIVFSAVEEAKSRLKNVKRFVVVGNPIRDSIVMKSKLEAREELGIKSDEFLLFSFGGSLGANMINKIAADFIEFNEKNNLVTHVHGYGSNGKERFPKLLQERGVDINNMKNTKAYEYINNMDTLLAAADLVICRAGAITLSEIEAAAKPSILVPSPNVTANHQYHNAMVLKNKDACIVLEEKLYQKSELEKIITELVNDRERLATISKNVSQMAILDSAKQIYENLKSILN